MKTRIFPDNPEAMESLLNADAPKERLMALDALRGLTVAVMILVNTTGDSRHTFPILSHSKWNGCTLLLAGLICALAGLIWEPWFPWNKRLWTSSFVLWTGGLSLIALCLLLWSVDVRSFGRRWSYPAIRFGTNALAAYVLSEFLAGLFHVIPMSGGITFQRWLYQPLAASIANPSIAAMTYTILFVAVCFLPTWLLYRRRIFLKI